MRGWQQGGGGRGRQPLPSGQVPFTGLSHGGLAPAQQGLDRVPSNSLHLSAEKQRAGVLCAGGVLHPFPQRFPLQPCLGPGPKLSALSFEQLQRRG